ncbi:MAG: putative glycolipid-binding domain-containing protein, partial [Dermatophilaceae bacterium]
WHRRDMAMIAWERDDEAQGHSVARWEETPHGYLFHGSEVLVAADRMLACSFRVRLDDRWRTVSADVTSMADDGERTLAVTVDDGGRWTVDGVLRPDLEGCVDIDIAATPLTNTFPIRRFGRHAVGEDTTTPVAWVDVPRLGVTRVDQTYERLPDRDGLATWRYSDPQHGAFELTVDGDGLVVDYTGFARRIRP